MANALKGKEMANFEFPLITKQGTRVEVLLNATSRRDVNGRVVGMVGIGQDITARIAQEQEYVRLIDTANAPIFGVDNKGKVTAAAAILEPPALHVPPICRRNSIAGELVCKFYKTYTWQVNSPGFATDFFGLLIIFPPTRKFIFRNVPTKKTSNNKNQDFINGEFEDIEDENDKKF